MPILNMIAQGSGGGGGGSNVGEPTNLSALATSASSVDITWTDNSLQAIPPSTFQKSVLVRKVGSAPTTPSDGTTVVTETVMNTYQSSAYSDTGLTEGTTYYYQVFSYSTDGGITYGTPVSATPQGGWQPGVNTIAYYPLTTASTVNDESGNSHTMSQSGGTFGIYQGVDCLNLSTSDYLSCTISQLPQGNDPVTISCWIYFISNNTSQEHGLFGYGRNQYHSSFQLYSVNYFGIRVYNDDALIQRDNSYLGKRLYLTGTSDGTDIKFYINGQMMTSVSHSQNMQDTTLYIGKGIVSYGLDGYISNCIVENVAWTQQDITGYYNITKGNYGIS